MSKLDEMLKNEPGIGRPEIVTLCGSSRFKDEHMIEQGRLTLEGVIVIPMGFYHHADAVPISTSQKNAVDELHLRKIDLSDRAHFVNTGGYIGESTFRELAYAVATSKKITFTCPKDGEDYMERNSHELGRAVAEFVEAR